MLTPLRFVTRLHSVSSSLRTSQRITIAAPAQPSKFLFSTSTTAGKMSQSPSPSGPTQRKGSKEPESAGSLEQPSGPEDWKQREPYRIHESDENFDARYEAHCHCGKVKYQLSREKPLASKYCHCTTCQRLHG
jgi:hypothetical protein